MASDRGKADPRTSNDIRMPFEVLRQSQTTRADGAESAANSLSADAIVIDCTEDE